jgi:hypothetical protein
MGRSFIVAAALALISLQSAVAGTEIIEDYGAQAQPPPTYNYAPPPPPPPTVYYAPPPVRVVVRPVRVFRVFAFHRARPRPYCAPRPY